MGYFIPSSAEVHLEKRKREWLVTRLLLHRLIGSEAELLFRKNGQPFLSNGRAISISHSESLAGIVTGEKSVGIDIQAPDEKIYRIRKRFCQPGELEDAFNSFNELEYLTAIWCAKEAVFKCFGERVHFSEDIRILPFKMGDKTVIAEYNGIHGRSSFLLRNERYGKYLILCAG